MSRSVSNLDHEREKTRLERQRDYADKFFQLIADHGRFNPVQLYMYVELRMGEELTDIERVWLLGHATEKGGKPETKGAIVWKMPLVAKRHRKSPKNRAERAAADLFDKPKASKAVAP